MAPGHRCCRCLGPGNGLGLEYAEFAIDRAVPITKAHRPGGVARAAFPRGTMWMRLRDELGVIYDDASFRALFATRGRPAEAPWRLTLVSVMQFAERLSDRQAVEAVRADRLEVFTWTGVGRSWLRCVSVVGVSCSVGRGWPGAAPARCPPRALPSPMHPGLEVLQRLKERQPTREIPIIIVSAYAMLLVRVGQGTGQ